MLVTPPAARRRESPAAAETSTSTLGNLPLALVLLVAARLLLAAQGPPGKDGRLGVRRRERDEAGEEPQRAVQFAALASTSSSVRSDRWREYVRSPVVEHAWETFCGSIVQQVGAAAGGFVLAVRWCQGQRCLCCTRAGQRPKPLLSDHAA